MKVSELMTKDIFTCSPEETLLSVAQKMKQHNVGSCPVVQNDRLVGIITDRDVTVRAVAQGLDPREAQVHQFMTPSPITGTPDMPAEEAAEIMGENQIRRLPIVQDNKLVGMISLADLAIDLHEEDILAETLEKISEPAR